MALGYNSTGLRIENSWTASWGDYGYATLAWAFVNQYVFDADSVGPLVTGQPVSASAPAVTGVSVEGQTLTATAGSWNPAATSYNYQWQRAAKGSSEWSLISGATSSKYVAAAAWNPVGSSYTYQWQRSTNSGSTWSPISTSATAPSYIEATADVNASLRAAVTATNSYGSSTAYSAAVGPVSGLPYNTVAPAVTGVLQQGQTLTATAGTWNPAGTSYTYQWQRSTSPSSASSWVSISAPTGTGASYVPVSTDVGASLRVVVTALNSYGQASSTSAAFGPVASGAPADSVVPVISGTARQGQTLTVTSGTWSPAATSYSYQWQHSSNKGSTWIAISTATATSSSYTLASADQAAEVRAVVTAVNAYGQATADSAATAPVAAS